MALQDDVLKPARPRSAWEEACRPYQQGFLGHTDVPSSISSLNDSVVSLDVPFRI